MMEEFQNNKHPSKDIQCSLGEELKGKTICVCVTGSVAIGNTPSLCRLLMRHGADVHVFMSKNAMSLVSPQLFHWSTGNPVITELTGNIEHVFFAGERPNKKGKADLVLIAPATANTISKISAGIDDTTVTTVATTAIGSKTPMIIVPAMHESMYRHPILEENIKKLQKIGIKFILPRISENKAKISNNETILNEVINTLSSKKDLIGKNFIVTAGPCREFIDRVRFISNPSSGKMGIEIANEIVSRGGNVLLVLGKASSAKSDPIIPTVYADSAEDFLKEVKNAINKSKYDVFISAAAISDYTPSEKVDDKICSLQNELIIKLKPTPKIIEEIRSMNKDIFIVAFKAETNLDEKNLINKAFNRLKNAHINLIVANDVFGSENRGFQSNTNEVYIIDENKNVKHVGLRTKRLVAKEIIDKISTSLKK